jgi:hypothetical protein
MFRIFLNNTQNIHILHRDLLFAKDAFSNHLNELTSWTKSGDKKREYNLKN